MAEMRGSEGALKADTVDLAAIFGKPVHYLVPLYQRPYVWTREDQWEPLWQDVQAVADRQLTTASNDAIPHFLGAVVLSRPRGSRDDRARSVIDGQQRLTTLQLLIAAARSLARASSNGPRQMSRSSSSTKALVEARSGDELKVLPTQRDRVPFRGIGR